MPLLYWTNCRLQACIVNCHCCAMRISTDPPWRCKRASRLILQRLRTDVFLQRRGDQRVARSSRSPARHCLIRGVERRHHREVWPVGAAFRPHCLPRPASPTGAPTFRPKHIRALRRTSESKSARNVHSDVDHLLPMIYIFHESNFLDGGG